MAVFGQQLKELCTKLRNLDDVRREEIERNYVSALQEENLRKPVLLRWADRQILPDLVAAHGCALPHDLPTWTYPLPDPRIMQDMPTPAPVRGRHSSKSTTTSAAEFIPTTRPAPLQLPKERGQEFEQASMQTFQERPEGRGMSTGSYRWTVARYRYDEKQKQEATQNEQQRQVQAFADSRKLVDDDQDNQLKRWPGTNERVKPSSGNGFLELTRADLAAFTGRQTTKPPSQPNDQVVCHFLALLQSAATSQVPTTSQSGNMCNEFGLLAMKLSCFCRGSPLVCRWAWTRSPARVALIPDRASNFTSVPAIQDFLLSPIWAGDESQRKASVWLKMRQDVLVSV